ncbi:MAG: PQQ-binding-like beta-propeller repeat protein [Acidobacteria bacterium]|nr:PQQ-binding-like beta-propeller repeat protein [Acidobacteriota bacterium]
MKMFRPVLAVSLLVASGSAVADWPHLRGPAGDGRLAAGAFEPGDLGLHLAWKAPLGSGYSGIALANGRAVTMFTDGVADWVVALAAGNGEQLWRYRFDSATKGADGSDDGPLSSPVIGGEMVYVVGSNGQLLALKLADGSLAWSKTLDGDLGAERPHFGFTTSPLVVDDVLVVLAGAEGHSVCGLDRKTGELLWSQGDDGVSYQSPAVMMLAGKRQVVAVTAKQIRGIDPAGGELLWTHQLGENDNTSKANPTFIDDDRFVVSVSGQIAAFKVSSGDGGLSVEELYRTRELGRSYAPPVYHDGHVYGFKGDFLTCVKADSGERVWRSRPPGGKGLILVDDSLVIWGAEGNVVIAEATSEGYKERTRFQALDGSSLTWPSFAYGRIYVRNLHEIAALNVTEGTAAPAIAAEPRAGGQFADWVRQVEAADNKQAMVDELFSEHERFPIVEGEYVHFLYRGEVEDLALAGSWLDADKAQPMHRIEGTDLYFRTVRLEPGARYEYRFQIDFGDWARDERNPREVPAADDDHGFSEVVMPGYEMAKHLAEPAGARGRIDTFKMNSEILGWEKEIRVWLPPDYDEGDRDYPLLLVNDGHAWLDKGLMANTLDNLVGKRVEPLIVAFVEPSQQWWLEAGGTRTDEYVRMQVKELLPALRERFRILDEPAAHAVMGTRFYGISAAYAALKFPEVFGKAAMQSVSLGFGAFDVLEKMAREKVDSGVRFYLDWNRYEERSVDMDWNLREDGQRLAKLLEEGGYGFTGGEVLDSHGWGGWRNRSGRMLEALFPAD